MALISRVVLGVTILTLFGIPSIQGAAAQTQFVGRDYFPAEQEFKELQKVIPGKSGEGIAALPDSEEAPILAEAGFLRYERRTYATESGSELSIEVLAGKDEKAAYSLLTIFRQSAIAPGPPGDAFAASAHGLIFARGRFWVRITGSAPPDLYRRIALSVSNRIGERKSSIPPLVTHLPQAGLEAGSVRYFLGPIALRSYGTRILDTATDFGPETEVAQANYEQAGASGVLSIIGFPTSRAADSFFESLPAHAVPSEPARSDRQYAKRVGPLVAILQGSFEPPAANEILGALKYTYSITWIYDKNDRNGKTIWGVPAGLLGTVVRSLLLVALLCVSSVILGAGMAAFRVFLRGYAPNNFLDNPERTGMIRLQLNDGPIPPASSSQKTRTNHES